MSPVSPGSRLPYVSAAEFTAYPEYLDLSDLVVGGSSGLQTDELTNMLLRASAAADGFCNQPIGARTITETRLVRVQRDGCVHLAPRRRPYTPGSLSGVKFSLPGYATSVDVTDLTGMVDAVSTEGRLYVPVLGTAGTTMPVDVGSRIALTYSYQAGYAHTKLTAAANAADSSITVGDPAGMHAGLELRIVDPPTPPNTGGTEEFVAVAAGWTPGLTTVTLADQLAAAHASGTQVSAVPQDVKTAVVLWTIGLLARPSSGGGADGDPFSDAAVPPTTQGKTSSRRTGRGLIAEARRLLVDGGYVRGAT